MKNKMPLDGLGLGHDSGSVHCDMLKMLCFRTAWGGGIKPPSMNTTAHRHLARQTAQMHPLSHFLAYLSLVEEKAAGIGVEMWIVDKTTEMNQVGSIFACLLIRLSRGMAVIFIRGIALSIRGIALR